MRTVHRTWALPGLMLLPLVTLPALLAPEAAEAQEASVRRISRGWQGETTMQVVVEMGAGILSIHSAPRGVLYDVQLRSEDPAPRGLVHRYTPGRLTVGTDWDETEGTSRRRIMEPRGLRSQAARMDLALGQRAPIDLEVQIGASMATLDLDQLPLRNLDIQVGAGAVELHSGAQNPIALQSMAVQIGAGTFEAEGLGFLAPLAVDVAVGVGRATLGWEGLTRPLTQLTVEVAMGQVVLQIPEGVGISMDRSGFLLRTRGEDLRRVDDRWVSANWEQSEIRLEISVSGALAGLEITRIRQP